MGEETENTEAPNWLRELEAKREQRLKVKLGHEAGAGAPCLTCDEKCPGLDLHFWRKICKNCKCAKENHDVHDDDIYGWAQFQLLGSKPNKSRKFKLPGKKEEIILEWTPKGHNETVDKFLTNLPPELLPVRGSAAAQERKQLLQKQIPIHDIDPSLCHDLTDAELEQMNEYIAHIKQNSVGVGHVVQLGLNRGNTHTIGIATEPQLLSSRFPAQLSNIQPVQLQAANSAAKLSEKLQNFNLDERKTLNISEDTQMGVKPKQIVDVNYPVYERVRTPDSYLNYESERAHSPNYAERLRTMPRNEKSHNPNYTDHFRTTTNERSQSPNYVERLRTAANDRSNYREHFRTATNEQSHSPNYAERLQTTANDRSNSPDYPEHLQTTNSPPNAIENHATQKNLPHYAPTTINRYNEQQTPQNVISNVRDLAFSTYDPNSIAANNYRNVKTDALNRNLPTNYPNQFNNIAQDEQNPTAINIGAINDINYDVKLATVHRHNDEIPRYQPAETKTTNTLLTCHRCKKPFEDDEIAIGIERTDALYHAACFKCNGCNQNLADMMYFYHKESDDVYCGRDYAKIKGIPRCQACDELIFVKEYCLAENSTFHVKHFCCFECDTPLAGQNYVMEDAQQPVCLPCYERIKAKKCSSCGCVIKPDETGAQLHDLHFHVNDVCFACKICRKSLLGARLLLKNQRLYCSAVCYGADK